MTAAAHPAPPRRTLLAGAAYALDGVFVLLVVFVVGLLAGGERGGDTFFSNLLFTLPILAAAGAAVAGGVAAALALRRTPPTSDAGRLAVRTVAIPVAVIAAAFAVGSLWPDTPPLALFGLALTVATVAVPALAVYARFARRDRAALLAIPLLIGVVIAIWSVGEAIGHD